MFMPLRHLALSAAVFGLAACASTITQQGLEQSTATAIGRPVGSFTISEKTEHNGGHINYVVKDKTGGEYRCYLHSPTGFQQAMSFGQTPQSMAVCTPSKAGTPPAACNALNKAAGRC